MNDKNFFKNSIGLLILAGGKSRRMGRDKVKLEINGKTFGEHIAANMGKYSENIFSANDGSVLAGFVTVADEENIKGKGPAAGIASALDFCSCPWLMVVPCDAPFVDEEVALRLWQKAQYQNVPVLACGHRGPEPLIGIYPKGVASDIKKNLLEGIGKVSAILDKIGYESVPIDDGKLVNVNNAADYEEIIKKYEKGRYRKA